VEGESCVRDGVRRESVPEAESVSGLLSSLTGSDYSGSASLAESLGVASERH
jgi:hypothetical protein